MVELLELLDVRLRTMWCHDDRGRITAENRPGGEPAPRLVVSRSPAGAIWRVGPDVTDSQVEQLDALLSADDAWHLVAPTNLDAILAVLGGGEIGGGPNFRPGASSPEPAGETVLVSAANQHVLRRYMDDWLVDIGTGDPVVAALSGADAVAVCASARVGAVVHEAGVETHPDHRGAGHGLAAVVAWRCAVDRLGAVPMYCTWWSNAASQRLARAAGFEHYATDLYVR